MTTPTYEETLALIKKAHEGQTRWGGEPYWTHPERVAQSLEGDAQLVGLLHDVLEDTDVTEEDLRSLGYSEEILAALDSLTHDTESTYAQYIDYLSGNALAVQVKLADLRDNMSDLKPGQRLDKYQLAQLFLISKVS